MTSGNGTLRMSGLGSNSSAKEAIKVGFDYFKANAHRISASIKPGDHDFHLHVVELHNTGPTNAMTLATFVALCSGVFGKPTGSVIDRYRYPVQEMEIRDGDELKLRDETKFGEVVDVDRATNTIDIRKGPKQSENHPASAFAHSYINVEVLEDSIFTIVDHVLKDGFDSLTRDLLFALPPRLESGIFAQMEGETIVDLSVRAGLSLDRTVLAIQGPPGAGKTFTGAKMNLCPCRGRYEGRRYGNKPQGHSESAR